MEPRIRTAAQLEAERNRRHLGLGLGALLGLAGLAALPHRCGGPDRVGPERLPPAPKRVRFEILPPSVGEVAVILTDDEGEQQRIRPGVDETLELAGRVQWNVLAPGYRPRHGEFQVAYGEAPPVRVEVQLAPLPTPPRRSGSRGFGRISAGGVR